jgi:hypothetical protein
MVRNDAIRVLIENRWVQLALLDPHSSRIHIYQNGQFEAYEPESPALERAATSFDWYRGWRNHLGFAAIDASEPRSIPPAIMEQAGAG